MTGSAAQGWPHPDDAGLTLEATGAAGELLCAGGTLGGFLPTGDEGVALYLQNLGRSMQGVRRLPVSASTAARASLHQGRRAAGGGADHHRGHRPLAVPLLLFRVVSQ